ncbi:STAS domain-containing protein [Desulfuribacillus stibiiarsenatis]|uniref:STAS domain-containing protein n=1 Tax=Desulfuribacillus stibiiarsenatis TaxID=1390249 RepID=UPI00159EFB68|nr:STAS domain-containing protein [Desulfuribacillus stibiiarsenatis]
MINHNNDAFSAPEVFAEVEQNIQIVHIKGKLNYGTTQTVKDSMAKLFTTADGYIIDLSNVENIDSTGFGVLINFAKRIAEIERKMAIVVTNDFIYDLFKISKFDLVFPLVKSKADGIKILKEGFERPLPLKEY